MKPDMTRSNDLTRRDFLKGASVATAMTMLGGIELLRPASKADEAPSMQGPPVPLAVIGLGVWGRELLATLTRIPEAQIAAVCDTYPAFLRRAGRMAEKAEQVSDYRKILDNKDIKAVIIATPTHLHKEIALETLQAGKHVYCEAPLATTVEDARAIALAAKKAPTLVFQAGLQHRADPQHAFVLKFIRSGAIGKPLLARAQWFKKQSGRLTAPTPEREKEVNWRLDPATSIGLVGEWGVHQVDLACWFLGTLPLAAGGWGALRLWTDGRTLPDTEQVVFEYPDQVLGLWQGTLANSFLGSHEVYYGSDAAILIRDQRAWLFKEVDAPLLGWEVYASKQTILDETGIVLRADASKAVQETGGKAAEAQAPKPPSKTTLEWALGNFLTNVNSVSGAVEDYAASFDIKDTAALTKYLAEIRREPAAGYLEGYQATVCAIKANEAIRAGRRITFSKEWFDLS
jgi:predicted dehydrogenase